MGKVKKYSFMLLIALMTVLVVVACSNNEESSAPSEADGSTDGETAVDSNQPLDIKLVLNFDGVEAPSSGNDVETKIEELTNSNLEITHMVSANFCERLPVLIASGDLPDVIPSCGAPTQPYLISAMQDGVFWEVGQYLEQFPTLASMPDIVYDNVKVNDELYGLPRYRPLSRFVTMYRKDWLDNLGIAEPTNHEELLEAYRAVTNNDPNGSGTKDTRGLTSVSLPGDFGPDFGIGFGAPNEWEVDENGSFTRNHETPEFLEALKFTKQLVEEGLVNSDLVAPDRTTREADFENGISGFWAASTNNVVSIASRLQANHPEAEVGLYNALVGETGEKRLPSMFGSNGILMFPKATVKTEEDLLAILGFFEELASNQEAIDLLAWGFEGVHHELVDGKPSYIDYDQYMTDVGFGYRFPLVTAPIDDTMTQGDLSELEQLVRQIEVENNDLVVVDPSINLVSEVRNNLGADLDQLINDAKFRFVTGAIDEDGWNAAVQQWRDRGGDDVREDLERLYAERNN